MITHHEGCRTPNLRLLLANRPGSRGLERLDFARLSQNLVKRLLVIDPGDLLAELAGDPAVRREPSLAVVRR